MFARSAEIIEQELEKKALELKSHAYLGDADWSTVWRYLPVFTLETYWERISKGHLVLTDCEVEMIRCCAENEEPPRRPRLRLRRLPRKLRDMWKWYAIQYNRLEGVGSEEIKATRQQVLEALRTRLVTEDQVWDKSPVKGPADGGAHVDEREEAGMTRADPLHPQLILVRLRPPALRRWPLGGLGRSGWRATRPWRHCGRGSLSEAGDQASGGAGPVSPGTGPHQTAQARADTHKRFGIESPDLWIPIPGCCL
jgi:hypothetical protein